MIYDMAALRLKYKDYGNLNQKIALEAKKGLLFRIKKGLYSDTPKTDKLLIANLCYGPSYLSFEYALHFYDLIPEEVTVLTSACFRSKNRKKFSVAGISFEYRRIPDRVFPSGIDFPENEEGWHFKMASPEKALCDTLYSKYPVRSVRDVKMMLFDDLRIDEEDFLRLDLDYIRSIVPLYRSNTLAALGRYIGGLP